MVRQAKRKFFMRPSRGDCSDIKTNDRPRIGSSDATPGVADSSPPGSRGARAAASAVAALMGFYLLASVYDWSRPASPHLRLPRAEAVANDEPQYILMATSLVRDHDLDLQDDYARVAEGGDDAGAVAAGKALVHHTFILDPAGGGSVLWARARRLPETGAGGSPGFSVLPGAPAYASFPGAVERPAHPPAVSAVVAGVAAVLALASRGAVGVEATFALVNLALGALAILATYWAGRALLPPAAAASTAALLAGASPWLWYGQLLLVEPAASLLLVLGLGAVLRRRPIVAGLMAVGAFWIKPPFVVAGLAWIIIQAVAGRRRDAVAIAGTCLLGGLGLLAFNLWMARTPFVSGNEGFVAASGVSSAVGTLVEPGEGLLVFVPWVLPTVLLAAGLLGGRSRRADLAPILLPALLYYPIVSSHQSLGGYGGPRYWIPMMPMLAIAAGYVFLARPGRPARTSLAATVALAAAINLASATCIRSVMNFSPHVVFRDVLFRDAIRALR
jgi:hypothetical protein